MSFIAVMCSTIRQVTTSYILLIRNHFKVFRIYAGAIATKMVYLEPVWDRADAKFIGESMRHNAASILPTPERPVASSSSASRPFPAPVIENAHLRPEAGRQARVAKEGVSGRLRLHRKVTPFGVTQPEVIRLAAAFIIP